MSVTLKHKSNGSFSHEMQWKTDGTGKNFTGWTPSCRIEDKNGVLVHEFTFGTDMTWIDITIGKILFKVIDTSGWKKELLISDWVNTQDSDSFARVTANFYIQNSGGVT